MTLHATSKTHVIEASCRVPLTNECACAVQEPTASMWPFYLLFEYVIIPPAERGEVLCCYSCVARPEH